MNRIKDLINSAGGRFVSVAFIKSDNTRRRMTVQPAKLKHHLKGRDASERHQRAAETRRKRHPHLMPVWDVQARAIRSVNLATVETVTMDGPTHDFRNA